MEIDMSENKDYGNDINESIEEKDEDIEFIDYDIDAVKTDDSDNQLDFQQTKKVSVKDEIISWVKTIIFAVVAAVIINSFIIINATVPTGSMENTIMTKDRLIGLRLSYIFSEPKRGDIVVFKFPLDEKTNYIKRVIGLPGETVKIEDGLIYVYDTNTGELKEGPLDESSYLKEEWVRGNDGYTFVVPEDRYLMMGDNRNYSADARTWQDIVEANPDMYKDENIIYVHKDKILGKAYFTYWSKFKWIAN